MGDMVVDGGRRKRPLPTSASTLAPTMWASQQEPAGRRVPTHVPAVTMWASQQEPPGRPQGSPPHIRTTPALTM